MAPSKSKHPTKSMAEASSKSKKPSTMAPKLRQPRPVVEEHCEEMTEREEHQTEEDYVSESAFASSEEKNAEEEQEEEEEDGDESDSVSDDSAAVKPLVSQKRAERKATTPVVSHASSSKRSAETESVPNDSKRKKLTDNGDEHDAKKGQGRLWTEQDELAILNGLIGYQQSKKKIYMNADIGDFHPLIKKNLHLQADDGQLSNKIRKLRFKYYGKGQHQVFTKPHDVKMYELSKKIWEPVLEAAGKKPAVAETGENVKAAGKKPAVAETGENVKAAGKKPAGAEMGENVKSAGEDDTESDDFWSMYPSLSLCLSSHSDLSSQVMQKKMGMLGGKNAKMLAEFEKVWSDIHVTELELGCKKNDAMKNLTKFVLDLMDSGSKE